MHTFTGQWITDGEFCALPPRNVFYKQLQPIDLPCDEHRNRHILFRKTFTLSRVGEARVYISADDYYKLYINGRFAGQGPAPGYHFQYNYNVIDVTDLLTEGENTLAVHTLYQGLINRVWVSGDQRHGLILDLEVDGKTLVSSDESFRTHPHTGFREVGTVGYKTQFLEEYDSNAPEVGFEQPAFDDAAWQTARLNTCADYTLVPQKSAQLVFESVAPVLTRRERNCIFADFGSNYVGYLRVTARGKQGDTVLLRCGQELNDDGSLRFELRANCRYEEPWILGEGESVLDQFDYKAFRYAQLLLPEDCELLSLSMEVRHYPFALKTRLKPEYAQDGNLRRIWELCVHTQKYGVQEVIQDCMEREKGFYVGDGCYTALTHMLLTGDDSMVRKLIDDAFDSAFITDGLVTCLDCAFMQEIAEYPLMLIYLVLWHYRITGDRAYLARNYPRVTALLESYRRDYEKEGLLRDLDKWCVVEWPMNFRDGYDVDITEGRICHQAHVSINAYYIEAVRTANLMAAALSQPPYRDEMPLLQAFVSAFYLPEQHLFRDGVDTNHVSIIGNVTAFGLGLAPDTVFEEKIIAQVKERGLSTLSLFTTFLALMGFVRSGRGGEIAKLMTDPGAWLRMLAEDATTTFEGWGKDTKWNTSLFHMTMSYGALFLMDVDLEKILG